MTNFIESADSRETDIEIMEAILEVAGGNEAKAARIWAAPSSNQIAAIFEIVTRDGQTSTDFFWGASGDAWANV